MNKPDFLIIGPPRTGTTTLFQNLSKHPKIQMPTLSVRPGPTVVGLKEIHFFTRGFKKGLEWYSKRWPENSGKLLFEATPLYFYNEKAIKRIKKTIPNILLIMPLRNPINRAWSAFCRKKKGDPKILLNTNHNIIIRGIYVNHIKRWIKAFSFKQILIIKSEDYFNKTQNILNECFDFLGIEIINYESFEMPRKRNEHEIPDKVRKWLQKFYASHNRQLEKLLNRKFNWE